MRPPSPLMLQIAAQIAGVLACESRLLQAPAALQLQASRAPDGPCPPPLPRLLWVRVNARRRQPAGMATRTGAGGRIVLVQPGNPGTRVSPASRARPHCLERAGRVHITSRVHADPLGLEPRVASVLLCLPRCTPTRPYRNIGHSVGTVAGDSSPLGRSGLMTTVTVARMSHLLGARQANMEDARAGQPSPLPGCHGHPEQLHASRATSRQSAPSPVWLVSRLDPVRGSVQPCNVTHTRLSTPATEDSNGKNE